MNLADIFKIMSEISDTRAYYNTALIYAPDYPENVNWLTLKLLRDWGVSLDSLTATLRDMRFSMNEAFRMLLDTGYDWFEVYFTVNRYYRMEMLQLDNEAYRELMVTLASYAWISDLDTMRKTPISDESCL